MRTFPECVPCFFNQAVKLAALSGAGEQQTREILNRLAVKIPGLDFSLSPPELSRLIYRTASEVTGVYDPYYEMKKQSNRLALKALPGAVQKLKLSGDRLFTAVELAIAGNIIDYGVGNSFDAAAEIAKLISEEEPAISGRENGKFDYKDFRNCVEKSRRILYLADNAGEIVFDRLLMEEILRLGGDRKIFCAVKKKPIINDALEEDAGECGIQALAEVFPSGSDAPGTVPSLCSAKFQKILESADMVISKGQGNFEAFEAPGKPAFYLFMAKCPVVAREAGCLLGDINLSGKGFRAESRADIFD